jgi:phosphatidylglycerol lysyltransferase
VLTGRCRAHALVHGCRIDAARVAQAAAFNAGAFVIGMTAFGAAGLLWGAPDVAELVRIPAGCCGRLQCCLLLAVAALVVAAARSREIKILNRWPVRLPPPELAIRQLLISALDLSASAAALWFLLPATSSACPRSSRGMRWRSQLGLLSHVPGGLGVSKPSFCWRAVAVRRRSRSSARSFSIASSTTCCR